MADRRMIGDIEQITHRGARSLQGPARRAPAASWRSTRVPRPLC
jgi:hypothetical protein